MATVKISGLPAAGALAGTEEVPAVQTAATVKTTVQDIADVAITAVVGGAPAALDTLDKLAAAIADDATYSTTVSTALALKADLASPALSGTPTAPTPTAGDNTTKIATTAFVKSAVDASLAGLSWKQAVRAATTIAGTLATSFENGDTIDGVVLVTGDRILIKNQATASENGIYIVTTSGAPTRATDADTGTELVNASVYVSEGTLLADTQWTCSTNGPITVGSTNLTFAQLMSGGGTNVATDTIWDAKGDLAVATGADAASKLSVGTNGQVLTADSTQTTGVKWATPTTGGSKTYSIFTPMTSQPPTSNFATLDTRNSIAVLDFDDTTAEGVFWVGIIPEGASLGSGLIIRIHFMATTATTGGVTWECSIERMNTDEDSDSFDTVQTGSSTTNSTSGVITVTSITITTIDSVSAGDAFRLKIRRLPSDGSDTMVGDAELVAVEVRSAA